MRPGRQLITPSLITPVAEQQPLHHLLNKLVSHLARQMPSPELVTPLMVGVMELLSTEQVLPTT